MYVCVCSRVRAHHNSSKTFQTKSSFSYCNLHLFKPGNFFFFKVKVTKLKYKNMGTQSKSIWAQRTHIQCWKMSTFSIWQKGSFKQANASLRQLWSQRELSVGYMGLVAQRLDLCMVSLSLDYVKANGTKKYNGDFPSDISKTPPISSDNQYLSPLPRPLSPSGLPQHALAERGEFRYSQKKGKKQTSRVCYGEP